MQKITRIQNPTKLDYAYIDRELNEGSHVIVQYSDMSFTPKILAELDALCKKYNRNFGIRFYSQSYELFDCKLIKNIPNVKCLYVDSLMAADNIMALTELTSLKKFVLGIYGLKETEILDSENFRKLEELIIGSTKSTTLNLEYLARYNNLKVLCIVEHTKNIEAVGNLSGLESLSLNCIKNIPIGFINKLKKLKTLNFMMGGRENILEVEGNNIESLEIIQPRGFNDLSNISRFQQLKTLVVTDVAHLEKIHFDQKMPFLKSIRISRCKTFKSLTGLQNLVALERLDIFWTDINFDLFINQEFPTSLKTIIFNANKKAKLDEVIKQQIKERGYTAE